MFVIVVQPKDCEDSASKQLARLFGQPAEYLRSSAAVDPPGLPYLTSENADLRAAVVHQAKALVDTTSAYQDWYNQLAGDALSRLVASGSACALSDTVQLAYYGVAPFCPFAELREVLSSVTLLRWVAFLGQLVFDQTK